MTVSAFSGIFANAEATCTYRVTSGTTTNAFGDVIPDTTSGSLVVLFQPSASTHLQSRVGADIEFVPGTFRCINPSTLPTGLGVGSVMDMTWNGQSGQVTIVTVLRKGLGILDETLGQEFLGEWRPT